MKEWLEDFIAMWEANHNPNFPTEIVGQQTLND